MIIFAKVKLCKKRVIVTTFVHIKNKKKANLDKTYISRKPSECSVCIACLMVGFVCDNLAHSKSSKYLFGAAGESVGSILHRWATIQTRFIKMQTALSVH